MITLIAAVDAANGIGSSNGHPWYSPPDLAFFYHETMDGVILVDRPTKAKLPHTKFPGRKIILTEPTNIEVSLRDCRRMVVSRVYAIGEAAFLSAMMPYADRILLSNSTWPAADGAEKFPNVNSATWVRHNYWLTECDVVPSITEYMRRNQFG